MNSINFNRRTFLASLGAGMLGASGLLSADDNDNPPPEPVSVEGTPPVIEFEARVKKFVEQNSLEDGTVQPKAGASTDVLLLLKRFTFTPASLELKKNVAYRFQIMAGDIPHGVWIKPSEYGPITLTAGEVTTRSFTFRKPGRYFIFCSTYCGAGHDKMRAQVQVV